VVYKVKLWMHAALVFNSHLHLCTEARCQTKCLEYANKYHLVVKNSQCYKANLCHCECSAKQHQLTTESMGLADSEDDNGSFV
jgi:hydroxyacyl-ACP dehydratase HTD2-like protein with hotdog domain